MLNSLEQTLERIEGALASNAAKLDALLAQRPKARPAKPAGASKADAHDVAVAHAILPMRISEDAVYLGKWEAFCLMRKRNKDWLSSAAIKLVLGKLEKASPQAAMDALDTAIINDNKSVYPQDNGSAVYKQDWFNGKEQG